MPSDVTGKTLDFSDQKLLKTTPDLSTYKKLFIDTETTGLDPDKDEIVLIQVCTGEETFVIDAKEANLEPLKKALEDKDTLKVFHNAAFDGLMLREKLGCEVQNVFDTLIAEKLLTVGVGTKGTCELETVAKKYLGIDLDKSNQKSFTLDLPITPEMIEYAAKDAAVLPEIFEAQKKALYEQDLIPTAELEFSIIPAMMDVKLRGILLDQDKIETLRKSLQAKILHLETCLREFANINFRSPKQVLGVLKDLGFNVLSTGTEVLEGIEHSFAKLMVEHREASKLFSTYAEALPKRINSATGRIHPRFIQASANTGRMSCEKPNLQQIPKEKEWRDIFVAPPGYKLVTADYSQIELRILAELAQDQKYIEIFKAGEDLHQRTADLMGISRRAAKAINFGIIYGSGPAALAKSLGISVEAAKQFIDTHYSTFPAVKRCLEGLEVKPFRDGYTKTMLGRKRFFSEIEKMREEGEVRRQGRNTPIQGTCVDILKQAIYLIWRNLRGFDAGIVLLVHDEIVIECRDDLVERVLQIMKDSMTQAGEEFLKSVPVTVEITVDQRWKK